ncbi:MAG: hypothetical protein CVU86_04650 [Firmicutes bacterium HGW-Firmicutes-11]|jgi:lipoprotein-anchoring transpeptidase ErfK/SrfK|nr:MAG: hypothetical protein CVU86_04650 [Firmicutes bacterium HGW-Firmicutes-11]
MKQNYGLILTSMILMSMVLFLVFVSEGREERILLELAAAEEIGNERPAVPSEEEEPDIGFAVSLRYESYTHASPYYIVLSSIGEIRAEPSMTGTVIAKPRRFEVLEHRIDSFPVSEPDTDLLWYPVTYATDAGSVAGFIEQSELSVRRFEFARMEEAVAQLDRYSTRGDLAYIKSHGDPRGQNAYGYPSLNDEEVSVPLPDGTLVRYLFSNGTKARVMVVGTGQRYYVESGFLGDEPVQAITKVIVIDRSNQNEAVYEKNGNTWTRISETLATTGTSGRYSSPTPLGFYLAMEKREQFYYYKDGTTVYQGYAPYAIRFTGRAYIHGVPVDFRTSADGQRIKPPMQEFSKSIGTIPLSHKCVRNYTSHAKFLYDWFSAGETAVIVIE